MVQTSLHMGGMQGLALLAFLWGLFVTVFYMVCAWRAMRAHERLSQSVEEISRKQH